MYMICKRVHVRVFSDSRNVQKLATKSDTSVHCLGSSFPYAAYGQSPTTHPVTVAQLARVNTWTQTHWHLVLSQTQIITSLYLG